MDDLLDVMFGGIAFLLALIAGLLIMQFGLLNF
jgi:hypothetical protein